MLVYLCQEVMLYFYFIKLKIHPYCTVHGLLIVKEVTHAREAKLTKSNVDVMKQECSNN